MTSHKMSVIECNDLASSDFPSFFKYRTLSSRNSLGPANLPYFSAGSMEENKCWSGNGNDEFCICTHVSIIVSSECSYNKV